MSIIKNLVTNTLRSDTNEDYGPISSISATTHTDAIITGVHTVNPSK